MINFQCIHFCVKQIKDKTRLSLTLYGKKKKKEKKTPALYVGRGWLVEI